MVIESKITEVEGLGCPEGEVIIVVYSTQGLFAVYPPISPQADAPWGTNSGRPCLDTAIQVPHYHSTGFGRAGTPWDLRIWSGVLATPGRDRFIAYRLRFD